MKRKTRRKTRSKSMKRARSRVMPKTISNRKVYWTTKEGQKILIKDLTNEHLINIIAMLKRRAEANLRDAQEAAAMFSSGFSGDTMAAYYADRDSDTLADLTWEGLVPFEFDFLIIEALRRGLKPDFSYLMPDGHMYA